MSNKEETPILKTYKTVINGQEVTITVAPTKIAKGATSLSKHSTLKLSELKERSKS
jgi:hypothetical protein